MNEYDGKRRINYADRGKICKDFVHTGSMGSVTVQQLMTELDASESTVRRDLNTLDANGQLVKVHGGAILKNMVYSTIDDEVVHRKEQNREAKDKIARYAAGLITAEDFVYIDAGTTTDLMIDFITSDRQCL